MKVVPGRSKSIPRHDIPHRNRGIIAKTWKTKKNVNIIYPLPKRRKAISTGAQSLDNCQGEKDVLPAGLLNLPK